MDAQSSTGNKLESMATKSFARFSQLPTEIRIMIWKESLPRRIIELPNDYSRKASAREPDGNGGFHYQSTPSVFSVNRESREHTQKEYTIARFRRPTRLGMGPQIKFLFNPHFDTINPRSFKTRLQLRDRSQSDIDRDISAWFQNTDLARNTRSLIMGTHSRENPIPHFRAIAQMPNLEKVYLMTSDGYDCRFYPDTILPGACLNPLALPRNSLVPNMIKEFKAYKERHPEWTPPTFVVMRSGFMDKFGLPESIEDKHVLVGGCQLCRPRRKKVSSLAALEDTMSKMQITAPDVEQEEGTQKESGQTRHEDEDFGWMITFRGIGLYTFLKMDYTTASIRYLMSEILR